MSLSTFDLMATLQVCDYRDHPSMGAGCVLNSLCDQLAECLTSEERGKSNLPY